MYQDLYFPEGPALPEICTCSPTGPSSQLGAAVNGSPCPSPVVPGPEPKGGSWTGDTLLPPETFRKGTAGQGRSCLSWEAFLVPQGQQKTGSFWVCPGFLPGIAVAGGRRQVMFTLLRPKLPKGFNQVFESAPGLESQNNKQSSLPDPQVTGGLCFSPHCSSGLP